jgi:hypothetical protein
VPGGFAAPTYCRTAHQGPPSPNTIIHFHPDAALAVSVCLLLLILTIRDLKRRAGK